MFDVKYPERRADASAPTLPTHLLMPVTITPAIEDALRKWTDMPKSAWGDCVAAVERVATMTTQRQPSVDCSDDAMPADFGDWFKSNYPKDTLIHDPEWHAKKIYWRAIAAQPTLPLADNGGRGPSIGEASP